MRKKGLTLIELIVIIAIIATLAAIIIPAFLEFRDKHDKNPKPTDDWIIVLNDNGNTLYNCRSLDVTTAGTVYATLLDGTKLQLSAVNCIVLEDASEDTLYAMKKQYLEEGEI